MAERNKNHGRTLNEIPEELLIQIISYLPTHESVRSSVLSRKWRNLWCYVSSLDFDSQLFPLTPDNLGNTSDRFAIFVRKTLRRRSTSSPIDKFVLLFDAYDNTFHSRVDSWIRYSISHNVKDLDINFFVSPDKFELSLSRLKDSQVRDLRLISCDLRFPSNVSSLKLKSIRSLYLCNIRLRDQMVEDLMSACVNLEDLHMNGCVGMKKFRICSSTLKELTLDFFDEYGDEGWVEISCPNLRCLTIDDFMIGNYCIKNSTSLVEAFVFNMGFSHWSKVVKVLGDVKHLYTGKNYWYKLLCENVESSQGLVYRNLEDLGLFTGYSTSDFHGMAALFAICPNITTLTLHAFFDPKNCDKPAEKELENIKFCIPNLKTVYLRKNRNEVTEETSEKEFVTLIKKYGGASVKIVYI